MSTGQDEVDRYFDDASEYWHSVYGQPGVQGTVYRRRLATAASWIEELDLETGAHALEAGCGAGWMTVALARTGLRVVATDSSEEMVSLCRRRVAQDCPEAEVTVQRADAHELPFESEQFELAVGIGLLPWLHDPQEAIAELVRVLRPGGWLILTADNRRRLNRVVEPRENPLLAPLKQARRRLRESAGWVPPTAQSFRHAPDEIDAMLRRAGVTPRRRTAVGFGPFTFLGHPALSDSLGSALDRRLERFAGESGRLRLRGWHYIVAGSKDATAHS